MRRHIDLFSGIGGFSLAAHWAGFTTEVFCERDEFCQKVLNKHWPAVPIVSDIHEFPDPCSFYEDRCCDPNCDSCEKRKVNIELLTAGVPCQPASLAGKRGGTADDRWLWPKTLEIIFSYRPRWVVLENVYGLITLQHGLAFEHIVSDLENDCYATQAFVIPAVSVNAPHRRDRVWIVAHSESRGRDGALQSGQRQAIPGIVRSSQALADAPQFTQRKPADQTDAFATSRQAWDESGDRRQPAPDANRFPPHGTPEPWGERGRGQFEPGVGGLADELPARMAGHFDAEPDIPRVAAGIPQRAAKLKALGNSIVPEVAYQILRHLGARP
jgi:DNA (cytosine-5)-methyltransferase 1